jgi:hypothetical protein
VGVGVGGKSGYMYSKKETHYNFFCLTILIFFGNRKEKNNFVPQIKLKKWGKRATTIKVRV